MKKLFIFSALIGFVLMIFSCGPTPQKAANYNDKIIILQRKAYKSIYDLQNAFSDFVATNDLQMLKNQYNKTLDTVKTAAKQIEQIGPFYKDSSLINGAKDLFKVYVDVLENEFFECIRIYSLPDEQYTEQAREEFIKNCKQAQKKLKDANMKFFNIQQKFAHKNNLILDTTY